MMLEDKDWFLYIPIACWTIHNFLKLQQSIDTPFNQYDIEDLITYEQGLSVHQEGVNMNVNQVVEMTGKLA